MDFGESVLFGAVAGLALRRRNERREQGQPADGPDLLVTLVVGFGYTVIGIFVATYWWVKVSETPRTQVVVLTLLGVVVAVIAVRLNLYFGRTFDGKRREQRGERYAPRGARHARR